MSFPPASTAAPFDVLVLTTSTDGRGALSAVLADLPTVLSAAVLIGPLPDEAGPPVASLSHHTPLPVHWAENGTTLQPGHVYVSPPQMILEVRPGGRCAVTPPEGELSSERPQDRLLASLAVSFGARALAVILAGPGQDGLAGTRALRGVGGTVLVQDPATADPADLPHAVVGAGAADRVVSPQDLGRTVTGLLAGQGPTPPPGEAAPGRARATQALREGEEQTFLLRLSDALRPLADPVAVQGEACRWLAERLDVDRAYYVEVDEAAGVARVARDWVRGSAPSLAGEHRVADFGWSVAILRRGECHVITDTQTSELVPPQDRPASAALGIIACMGAPLIKEGRLVGAPCVTASRPRVWQEGEVELLREVGERIWAAVERARSEQALAESEEKYRTLFELMDQGYCDAELVRDAGGRVVDVRYLTLNPAFERIFGLPTAAAIGRTGREVFPGVEDSWFEMYDLIARSGKPERFEHELAPAGMWLEVQLYPRGGDRLLVLYDDITRRKRAEQVLRESEARQAFLLRLGDALRPLADPTEIQQAASGLLGEYLGVSRTMYAEVHGVGDGAEALVRGQHVRGGSPFPDRFSYRAIMEGFADETMRGGGPVVVADVASDPRLPEDVRQIWQAGGVAATVGVSLVKDGRVVAMFGVHDARPREWTPDEVTLVGEVAERTWAAAQRARAEEALRESEGRARTLIKNLPGGAAFILDRDLRYRLADGELLSAVGAAPQDYEGRTIFEVMPPDLAADLEPFLRRALAGEAFEVERAQDEFAFVSRGVPLRGAGGEVTNVLVVSYDISARQRAEAALRAGEARQAFLLKLSDRLRALADPWQVQETAARLLVEHLGVGWAYYFEMGEDEDTVTRLGGHSTGAPLHLPPGTRISDFHAAQLPIFTRGQTVVHADVENAPGFSEADRAAFRQTGTRAAIAVPLLEEGRFVALLGVSSAQARHWTAEGVDLVEDVAQRTWAAVGRARAEEALRSLNATLEARVEERTRRLAELNTELASRTRALEAFAELTRDLAPHIDPRALIRRGQEIALSLLPGGFATYYEPEGGRWRLRAQVGDMRNPALQAAVDAGLLVGGTPSLDRPWASGAPLFQEQYHGDTDGLGEVGAGVDAGATFPLSVDGERLGVFAVALFSGRAWSVPDRAVLETVVRSLGLALERAAAVRALAEEREALAAFAHFTERAADTREVGALIRQATDVLGQVLGVDSAVYFEREGEVWRLRHASGPLAPDLEDALRGGVPAGVPGFALPEGRREPTFFEHWNPGAQAPGAPVPFRAVAAYPLFPPDHPAGMLSMAVTDRPAWTERERAVFRAVGDSFRLALERTAHLQQVERQRERLADLNAEVGTFITRTARSLEIPVGYLSRFLSPGRLDDLLADLPPHAPSALEDELTRLRGVAQDLRQLARLEDRDLNRELLPLGELFAEVRAKSPPAGRAEWLVDALPIVRADRALLRQALEVLLTFTLSETRGTRTVDVSSQEVGGEVWVTVQDDGVGLEPEEAATLFDLAVRTEQAVPLLPGGGLVQVRRILARHGGWAWAESRLRGGRVVLAFPRDETVSELEALFREGGRET